MEWVDVAGAPGVGKSTICDPVWGPHDIVPDDTPPPKEWHDFLNEITRLLGVVRKHPSFVAAVRMNRRSVRKMAVVNAMAYAPGIGLVDFYMQTGFIQRGLGFGWRLLDMGIPIEETQHFWRLMPVSRGIVFLEADRDIIKDRNKERELVKETAHENRSFMVDYMIEAADYARKELECRDVHTKTFRTHNTGSPVTTRADILAHYGPLRSSDSKANGSGSEGAILQRDTLPPTWW